MIFYETSALTGEFIETAFQHLLTDIHKKELQKPPEERGTKTVAKNTRKKTDAPAGPGAATPAAGPTSGGPTPTAKPAPAAVATPPPQHTIQVAPAPPPQEGGCPC
eukprot:TRINITY_DN1395_c0_g1_i2.p1 TRINITY_DN1395_c0_g1~~TRINITY_DN1395_c0_g1_i2.p1  ORF type:complete len:106 (-),score=43.05 TRINITY_DN1395_c0_g1_i2:155-472(-)